MLCMHPKGGILLGKYTDVVSMYTALLSVNFSR